MLPAGDQDEVELTEIVNKIIIVASSRLFVLLYERCTVTQTIKQKIFIHSLTEAYIYVYVYIYIYIYMTSSLNLLYIAKFEVLRPVLLQSRDF